MGTKNWGLLTAGSTDLFNSSAQQMCQTQTSNIILIDSYTALIEHQAELDVICVPGGRVTPKRERYGSQGMALIRDLVSQGTGYLGLCGGAYWAATERTYNDQNNLPAEQLGLMAGVACGPYQDLDISIAGDYPMGAIHSYWPQALGSHTPLLLYFQSGPLLTPQTNSTNNVMATLATTANNHKIAIYTQYGKGKVVLCGAHIELSAKQLQQHSEAQVIRENGANLVQQLTTPTNEKRRQRAVAHLLQQLN